MRWVHILEDAALAGGGEVRAGTFAMVLENGYDGILVRTLDPPGIAVLVPGEYEPLRVARAEETGEGWEVER